ncbi:MAG: VanW family protein [Actinomycetota bacterium]|nr:VanW family protein [Actinomycetota bacterium]
MRVDATSVRAGSDRSARLIARWVLVSLALLAVLTALIGLAFAGSTTRIAEGVAIAGVDVGGLTKNEARALLESRFERVARVPVVFTAGGETFPIKATTLGVEADWASAIETASREGEGFGPVRGFRRLQARFFGAEISPPAQAYEAALEYKVAGLARAIDQRHVEAKLVRRGLAVEIVAGQPGRALDRGAAAGRIVRNLARLERGNTIALPVSIDPVEVTAAELAPVARQARIALSAPIRLEYEGTRWKLPRWRIAELLTLPVAGETEVAIAGRGAESWFAKLRKTVERAPTDAMVRPAGDGVEIVPDKAGLAVDVPATAKALLAAVVSPVARTATLAVRTAEAERTTAEVQAMGIERRLASYTTLYAGTYDRITNLQIGTSLLNGALVAPGGTFSFNDRVGERTLERGFRPAPVIIKDEYEEDVGGGVSQVATTAFNAAWEAGLRIVERQPHSLYISRYQTGRDATVNFPDLDLRFVNDTPKWILVAGAYGGSGITVSIYGGGPERRVESGEGSIRETGPAPIRRVPDATLERGTTVIEEKGSPARATSVTRTVYDESGAVLYDETWNTSYRGEYEVIRVGTKPPPEPVPVPEPKPADKPKPPKGEAPPPATTAPTPTLPPATPPAAPRP